MAARTKFKTCFTLTDDALRDQPPRKSMNRRPTDWTG